jgi:hypothetical protein
MEDVVRAVTWDAPEHHHTEKTSDWFWVVGIIAIAGAIAAFFFGNFLFAILILLAAVTVSLAALRKPRIIPFSVTTRGVSADDTFYAYSTLESYRIDDEHYATPQLLLKTKRFYMPLILIPLPEEYLHDIDDMIGARLPEEDLEEPLINLLLEFLGL